MNLLHLSVNIIRFHGLNQAVGNKAKWASFSDNMCIDFKEWVSVVKMVLRRLAGPSST